jgi:hypothetical protein
MAQAFIASSRSHIGVKTNSSGNGWTPTNSNEGLPSGGKGGRVLGALPVSHGPCESRPFTRSMPSEFPRKIIDLQPSRRQYRNTDIEYLLLARHYDVPWRNAFVMVILFIDIRYKSEPLTL